MDIAQQIRGAASFEALSEAIRAAEFSSLDSRSVMAAARRLAALPVPATTVRVAMLGTHTMRPLPDYLRVRGCASGRVVECWVGPYGQYMQPVSPPAEALLEFNPDIVLLSAELDAIAPRVVHDFASLSESDAEHERRRIVDHLVEWAGLVSLSTDAAALVCNFPRPVTTAFGVADGKRTPSESGFYQRLNVELADAFRDSLRGGVLDLESVIAEVGADRASAHRMKYIARQPWHPATHLALVRRIWRHVIAEKGWARKCLVLDLDNTLWGGVAGEDGPEGLKIGSGDPVGEAFWEFQSEVKALTARGVILAVASKNNVEDVEAVFRARRQMPLQKKDFAAIQLGWGSKASSLEAIASALSIGIDSLVFLDDNPAERAIIRGSLPEVLVPELPDDPALYASFLRRQGWFETARVTGEDTLKVKQYREQAVRASVRAVAGTVDRYLEELGTELVVRRAGMGDVPRVHQLFTKTNQFNITTRRYSLGEVEALAQSDKHLLMVASARDRFGDLGLIGVYLVELVGKNAILDSFLLSCRALGRGIETALMNTLKRELKSIQPEGSIVAHFVPTPKNEPARDFLSSQGFEVISVAEDGTVEHRTAIAGLDEIAVSYVRGDR